MNYHCLKARIREDLTSSSYFTGFFFSHISKCSQNFFKFAEAKQISCFFLLLREIYQFNIFSLQQSWKFFGQIAWPAFFLKFTLQSYFFLLSLLQKAPFYSMIIAQLRRKILFLKNQHGDNVTLFITKVLLERVWLPRRLNNQFSVPLLLFIASHLNRIFVDEVFTKNGKTTRHYFGSLWNNSV